MHGYEQCQVQVIYISYITGDMQKNNNLNENNQWSYNRKKKVKHEDCEITRKRN